ncbi:MAG: hypothetical protein RL387_912, partial [Bacteroidota bacterium]|jgi:hypothetical protein
LNAAVACLAPTNLTIPENIIALIPPRPPMYYGVGELFDKRTGMSFDALSAAEALTDFQLSFLFNTERANRLVQNKARAKTIGFDDLTDAVMKQTWHTTIPSGLLGSVHMQTQQQVLTWLLGLSQSTDATYEVRALAHSKLKALQTKLETLAKSDIAHQAHYQFAIERIKNPGTISLPKAVTIPPGAPIGCDVE